MQAFFHSYLIEHLLRTDYHALFITWLFRTTYFDGAQLPLSLEATLRDPDDLGRELVEGSNVEVTE